MNEMRRVLALFLCFVMLVGMMPVGALAGEVETTAPSETVGEVLVTEAPATEAETTVPVGTTETETTAATEESVPVTTVPTEPQESVPETTVVTEPEESVPETTTETQPQETEATEPAETVPGETLPEEIFDELLADLLIAEAAAAADGTTYVLAGSDFQAEDGTTAGVGIVESLLSKVKETGYSTMDGFLFAGDYNVSATKSSDVTALKGTVQGAYPELTDEDIVLIQGNHDDSACYSGAEAGLVGSVLNKSGNNDADAYGVFVINEQDYMWKNDNENTVKQTAANLKTYLNAKRNAGYTKPIFVISHLPLNYNMRTKNEGDGKYANYIFDVLNEAGNAGLNIIFLFGHDHSNGWDDYLGGSAIYLEKGDKILVAQASQTTFREETLAFTYMNAGYVGYYKNVNAGAETDLTMTVFEITEDEVEIKRISQTGNHDLKSAGVRNSYKNETAYDPNTEVYVSPQTVTLNTDITPAGGEVAAPDSGTGSTTTERTYTRVTSTSDLVSGGKYLIFYDGSYFMLPEVVEKSSSSGTRKGFNVESTSICGPDTITGDYQEKEWVLTSSESGWLLGNGTQYAKLTSSSDMGITATFEDSGDVFTIDGSANAYTFTSGSDVLNYNSRGLINGFNSNAATFYIYRMTNEGSSGSTGPTVGTDGGDWVTITEPSDGTTTYKYTWDTDGKDNNTAYLIVKGTSTTVLENYGTSGVTTATITSNNGTTATATTQDYEWKIDIDNKIYTTIGGSDYYLVADGKGLSLNGYASYYGTAWEISHNNGTYTFSTSIWTGGNKYSTYYLTTSGISTSIGTVRLYYANGATTSTGTPGLYGKINGELTYNVEIGTSKENAVAAVKAGIDILYHTGDANAAQTFPDDGEGMTWTLDRSYDGVTPGEYAVTIASNGVTLGVAKVVVPTVPISGYSVDPKVATVRQGAAQSVVTGSRITVTLENGNYYTVPITVSMLSKDGEAVSTAEIRTYSGLTVTYNGVAVTNDFTLIVQEKVYNNYPEYPDEGAVKVSKTATGVDFQSSGIAQIELSASGVPAQKGADVVIVIDTSSSMDDDINGDTPSYGEKSRIDILSESLENMLLQFQQPDDSGIYPDIDIAIIDFNGYANKIDGASLNNTYRDNAKDLAEVYTGVTNDINYISDVGLSASNFVDNLSIDAEEMAAKFDEDRTSSGTNYDSGLSNAYKLLSLKKQANGDEDRDQYVIFLSDGAPFRYNGYENGGNSGYNDWDKWLRGYWENQDALEDAITSPDDANAYPYFYNGNGSNHPHRVAEAIKGAEGALHQVVVNTATEADPAYIQEWEGLGAEIYAIGFGLAEDGDGVDSNKGSVLVSTMQNVLQTISSGEKYYYDVHDADQLTEAFNHIATAINYAASNARFVDQMGGNFNLQMAPVTYQVVDGTNTTSKTLNPKIEILSYDIYTRQDYLNGTITEDKIGDRKGTYTVLETVTFNADGTEAYSDKINGGKTNILADGTQEGYVKGVIYAQTFLYNTNILDVEVTGVNIPTGTKNDGTTTGSTSLLPSETFYWKMGTVQSSELAMRYYVYLEGSMEGTMEAGSYTTNEFATLYYDNYLGTPCFKDTVSPSIAWKEANVSYAFYLVNENGDIIVNQTTGQTGSFANKIAITNPVVYKTVRLNDGANVEALGVAALGEGVLPTYYQIYDRAAVYKVTINSNTTGSWEITKTNGLVNSTYVTQYKTDDASAYSNALTNTTVGDDYTHTVVWFAVVWNIQAHPDTVVVDYGLPVDISVLSNDMFGEYGKLAGVGAYTDGIENTTAGTTLETGFGSTYTGSYGTAEANATTGRVRYKLKTMQMDGYEKFAYAVNYTGTTNSGYYYDTVTVIPATTIYYEDDFVSLESKTWDAATNDWVTKETSLWSTVGTRVDGTQDEDRPGAYSLTDANNIYGYDSVNLNMSTYSMGSALKATVDYDNMAIAKFTFAGTGFDVISMTSAATGTLIVDVFSGTEATGTALKSLVVDTYYGYKSENHEIVYTYTDGKWVKTEDKGVTDKALDAGTKPENPTEGSIYTTVELVWVVDPDATGALYQIPVIKVDNLTYGTYTVKISATYEPIFDHVSNSSSYDLYLDAIRIYDPANDGIADGTTDTTIEDVYKADGEGWPSYIELRNKLIEARALGNAATDTVVTGLVFIDGDAEIGDAQIDDYISYGPNNEVYLAPGQRVAFLLSTPTNIANVHIGIKSADGNVGSCTITNIARSNSADGKVTAGTDYNDKLFTVNTTTDMYYDLTEWKGDIIVISNTGNRDGTTGIISLTNIKSTYTSNPNGTETTGITTSTEGAPPTAANETSVYVTPAAVRLTLRSLNNEVEGPASEETLPGDPLPEETLPEEIIPEETVPETTEPEETVPEITEPEEEPEKPENPIKQIVDVIKNKLADLLRNWFR